MKINLFEPRFQPYWVYAWFTFVVLAGLLLPGYVLTLDMVFGPHFAASFPVGRPIRSINDLTLFKTIEVLSTVIPNWVVQKIILIAILFCAGLAMHRLVPVKSQWGKYLAGIFYMINPFVYTRFLAGQWTLLLGYAILPWVIASFMKIFKESTFVNALKAVLWWTLLSIFSLHFALMAGVLLLIIFCISIINISKTTIFSFVKVFVFTILGYIFLNSYWLFQFFRTMSPLNQISSEQFSLFQTSSDPVIGVLGNVLALYGFWGEKELWAEPFTFVKEVTPLWIALFLILLSVIVYGAMHMIRNPETKKLGWVLVISALLAIVISVGVALPGFKEINLTLARVVPFFEGFRDSQKWSAVLAFSYAIFFGVGFSHFSVSLRTIQIRNAVFALFMLMILLYSYPMLGGFAGQLRAVSYPQSWVKVEEITSRDPARFNILFLPWHQYMSFDFNDNRISAIPASRYFSKPVISGDNIELQGVETLSADPDSLKIAELIENGPTILDFGQQMQSLGIKYVILSKNFDWEEYDFLNQQQDLEKVYEAEDVVVYKSTADLNPKKNLIQ